MTSPISGLGGVGGVGSILQSMGTDASAAVGGAGSASGTSFANQLAGAVDGLNGLQQTSDKLAVAAVTGNLSDIHDATIAATRAQVTLELFASVRNSGVQAFNDIMRMQA